MAASNRQTKRRFQPSITSFFARTDKDTSPPSSIPSSHTSPLSPSLPATIQSSLLNVGMRVRKSVPEGYKTTSCNTSKQTHQSHRSSASVITGGAHNNNYRGGFAELTPYCGILKVGGYDSQPLSGPTGITGTLQIGNDDFDFVSSQDSASSTDTILIDPPQPNSVSKKRRFQDENIFGNVAVWEDDNILPATARFMAVPKTRRKWLGGTVRRADIREGQENIASDFEEADFLRAPELVEEEMEMDGL